jgi:hypothetical protein
VESGREALAALPAVGDLAEKIYAAAQAWVAAHAEPEPAAEAAAEVPAVDGERPPTDV